MKIDSPKSSNGQCGGREDLAVVADYQQIGLELLQPGDRFGAVDRFGVEDGGGVFVGHVNAMVRDLLWKKCCGKMGDGGVIQIWSTNTEQRFRMRALGDTRREIIDLDGLQLIRLPLKT